MYKTVLARQAVKDVDKLRQAGLLDNAKELTRIVQNNPYQHPPPYEKLTGNLDGYYSRRINRQHRFVYEVLPNENDELDETGMPYQGIVRILRMWSHYD